MFGKFTASNSNISFDFSFFSKSKQHISAEPSEHRSYVPAEINPSCTDMHTTTGHASTSSNIHPKQKQPTATINGTPIIRKPKPKRPRVEIPSQSSSTSTKPPKIKSKSKSNTNPQPQQKQKQRRLMIISEHGRPQLKLQIPQFVETVVTRQKLEPSETRHQIPPATNSYAKGPFAIGGRPMFPVYQVEVRPLNIAQRVDVHGHL
ncbi:hypothetical protein FA15DRAFT_748073 [Coprinopsis marcescibilis]|uniref:Uncharacterized protein n=1 Tax=Coprinopsis marcescibilis TaxID=230819 RepID=A0A5C3KS54_COPMA|nr:hypothetical protein FA15DRAFT_748073 [Coprinopsis marcescibilis]